MPARVVTFGEIMLRLSPPGFERFLQSPRFVATFGGGEANVAISVAQFGLHSVYVTALPAHAIGEAAVRALRAEGVDTSHVVRSGERIGIYYAETGASQRGSTVIYDRARSSISEMKADAVDWDAVMAGAAWFHVTGITPALGERGAAATAAALSAARRAGARVSCDLNFRKKLWNWRAGTPPKNLARECMAQVLPFVDVVIANEEDAADVLDIHAAETDVTTGRINAAAYTQVARQIVERFANVSLVAITLRESISANHNNWGGMLYDAKAGQSHFAPLSARGEYEPYEIRDIVDRVGSGDSFAAGLLYALMSRDFSQPDKAICFAVAASCLKHSVHGDFNYISLDEVLALVGGNATGRVQR